MGLGLPDLSGAMRQVQDMQVKLDNMAEEMKKQTALQQEQVELMKQLVEKLDK